MLTQVEVEKFRGLARFRMRGLGVVNLLVGTNNCGKTSALEAISMLMDQGSVRPLWQSLARRGETYDEPDWREAEIAHIFTGHEVRSGTELKISGKNSSSSSSLTLGIAERDSKTPQPPYPRRLRQLELYPSRDPDETRGYGRQSLSMTWKSTDEKSVELNIPLTTRAGILADALEPNRPSLKEVPVQFITTEALSRDQIVSMYETIALTAEEETVLNGLRVIEPQLERIAAVGSSRRRAAFDRGGVVARLGGARIPIGSMGDGIWRLLGIALALVQARDGVLLVDEIDTGLHYSVLSSMWKLVTETSRRLNVQVFATTHSRDCYESLSTITSPGGHGVSIQRIERGREDAIAFSESEIAEAASRGIEVR